MTQYFLDSSALIKRYIVEPGTTWVRSIIQHSSGNTIIIAQTTQIEIVSGHRGVSVRAHPDHSPGGAAADRSSCAPRIRGDWVDTPGRPAC